MSRIVIFGAGSATLDLLSVLPLEVTVVGLVDNDSGKYGTTFDRWTVRSPAEIHEMGFDFVVVAARRGDVIRRQLIDAGIDRDRILLFYPGYDEALRDEVNRDIDKLNRYLGIGVHRLSLCTMHLWPGRIEDARSCEDDFCRAMTLRLAAARIEDMGVPGAVAELGVYRGDFAQLISQAFPDRRLYLFDTFEGFSPEDVEREIAESLSAPTAHDFTDTNVDLVLSRMLHPQRVILRKGHFPATTSGIDEEFALVSIDVDLYQPTAAGLDYFLPRLSPGGSIFVHDYNNRRFPGVRRAVDEAASRSSRPVVLLPDYAGSAVLPG